MQSIRVRSLLFASAVMMAAPLAARAAPVVWYVDSSATSLTVRSTGIAAITGQTAALKMIVQGVTPIAAITPSIPAKLAGSFTTDTDFTDSIQFLSGGSFQGLDSYSAKPLPFTGAPGQSPAHYAGTIVARLGTLNLGSVADVALRNAFYDLTSAPIPISDGAFAANATHFGLASGRYDYRGYSVGSTLGSGNYAVSSGVVANTSSSSGSIVGSGNNATLLLPISISVSQVIAPPSESSNGLVMTLIYSGTLVAHTYAVPEPGSLLLATLGLSGLLLGSIKRWNRSRRSAPAESLQQNCPQSG